MLIVLLILLFVGVCSSDEPDDLFEDGGGAGGASASGGGDGGAGGAGGELPAGAGGAGGEGGSAECTTRGDCPGSETACHWRVCDSGRCTMGIAAEGTWASGHAMGDCLKRVCDDRGEEIVVPDPNDARDDGNECTVDTCGPGGPENSPAPDETPCSIGSCSGGVCTAAPTCSDGRQNGDEVGVDCGGSCDGCPDGTVCSDAADCAGGVCAAGLCACGVDHIVISEVMTRGSPGSTPYDEFIELYNPTSASITLAAVTIDSLSGILFGPQSVTLLPGQRFVIGGADFTGPMDASFLSGRQMVDVYQDIVVRDGAGPIIDALCYCHTGDECPPPSAPCEGPRATNVGYGDSMARRPAGHECNDSDNNSTDFYTMHPATPGY